MQVILNIPDNYILYINLEDLEKNFKLNTALIMYKQGKFSLSQATDFSGVDIYKFINLELNELIMTDIGLGMGELSSMILYKKINADRLLVDDKKARKVAKLNKIKIIGSLGILLLAKERALVQEIKPLISEIISS